jgi:hypothetical protein
MEDVLRVYARPYDARFPVVCLDEKSKELRSTPNGTLPREPGKAERIDSEYQRHGTANLFLWVEPLTGKRRVTVTERRTALDFAEQLRVLIEQDYPAAERIVLVTDNLNTHQAGCLYERFDPEQAERLAGKLEWHYTPEHGSWLNMAEIDLSVLERQCLCRRIADRETLEREVAAWQAPRDASPVMIRWQFTTADARVKLRQLYPVVKVQENNKSS